MTKELMCKAYANAVANCLSSSAERKMAELEKLAADQGLKFVLMNREQYMNPHFMGLPKYELQEV